MANSDSYDMDSDGNDSNGSHNELIIRHFGNPLYESYEYSEDLINNNSTESDANCSDHTVSDHRINGQLSTSDDTMNDTDRQACHTGATDAVMPVVRPKPRERTTIKRNNSSLKKSDIVYSNVTQNSDQGGLNCHVNSDKCGDSRTTSGQPSDERPMDELPTLISELENILIRMSSDSFYATPCASPPAASAYSCSPPPSLPPKVKPRRSQTTSTVSTTSTTSSLSLRPLPKPPKNIPPPKPPHLPPATPPPPLPDSQPPQLSSPHLLAPEVPSRFPIKDKILRDNVDMEGKIIHPIRKLSEPFHRTQPKIPIVDPYYCQHSDCRFKGIARSQTFRSSDKHNNHINERIMSPNHNKSIIQKCGYLWKTGSNRREFLDRWCVLHRNEQQLDEAVLAYYMDRKTTSARGKIMLKDIAFVRTLPAITCKTKLPTITSTIDSSNFCYFEIGVNCRRGRIYLFAAKCLSDQKLWFSIICQAVAWDNFTLKDTFHCGYVHMKYGISGQWLVNYVLLSEGKITVLSKDFDEHNDNKSVKSSDSDSYMSTDSCDSSNCYQSYEIRKAMSISYASVHQINSCSTVHESGQPICLTFPHKVLYFQCEYKTHTELWYQSFLKLWTIPENSKFEDQYLTNDSIPVAIDKCINFIATYGTDTPNIYIQQNLQSPVAQAIVHEFHNNAWDLQLRMDAHSVHDITAALILFLKSMSECILTEKLYHNWIKANEHENRNERLQKFKILLNLLPIVNYLTLKKFIAHIVCIIENSDKNQTSILNLAPALCHTILFLKCGNKIVDDRVSTFDGDSAGIDIMTDFIQSYGWLFDVTTQELEKERKIQKALELLKDAKQKELGLKLNKKSVSDCEEFLIGVYVYSREWGKCLNVKLTPTMSAADLIEYVVKKTNIKDNTEKLSVYEVVYNEQLERVLHYSDIVLGVTLSWVKWSQHYSRDNYLCIKQNKLYEQIASHIAIQTPITIFSEMKFADKASKSFKKVLVEFIGAKLSVYKDEKGEKSLGQWCVEDITWYLGAEKKRSHGNKLSVTFIDRNNPIVKTKECPYFGRVLCCNTEEDYHKWIAGMLCAEYPNGVVNNGNHRQQTDLMD